MQQFNKFIMKTNLIQTSQRHQWTLWGLININLVSKKGEGGNDAWMRDTKVAVLYLMLAYSKPMLNWIWKSHLNQESEQATWIVLMMTASCPLTKIQFKPSSRIYCSLVGFFHIQSITQHIYNQHHLPLAIGGGGGANKKWKKLWDWIPDHERSNAYTNCYLPCKAWTSKTLWKWCW